MAVVVGNKNLFVALIPEGRQNWNVLSATLGELEQSNTQDKGCSPALLSFITYNSMIISVKFSCTT